MIKSVKIAMDEHNISFKKILYLGYVLVCREIENCLRVRRDKKKFENHWCITLCLQIDIAQTD